ncbi:MAG: AI-2E family transporter [Candidatus Acidiferrales bacterium]
MLSLVAKMETQTPIISVANATLRTSSTSARIIAGGIVIAFCYWASSVIVTLLVAVLLAYFLDPIVSWLENWHVPRALGSFLIVIVVLAAVGLIGWILIDRIDSFFADWPKFRAPLRSFTDAIQKRIEGFEARVSEITPADHGSKIELVTESHPFRTVVFERLSSVYSVLLAFTFIPFLLFFMLAAKRQVWHATMQLFPASERTQVKETLADVSDVLRSYVVGTLMVGVILVVLSWLFFWAIGLEFAFLTGLVSGLLNLVPYLGVVMSWVPVTLVGLKQYHAIGPFLGIFAVLTFLHFITANLLFPAMVGRRVHLNALAVTIAFLFWGWLWGAAGLILAIPITATIKVICDHVEGWQPVGRWLGA